MTERLGTLDELRQLVAQLPGLRAWGVRAGSGTVSIFTLQFGELLPDKTNRGEYSIMVFCAWRLTDELRQLICTWHEDADIRLEPGLQTLHNQFVAMASVSDWGDLHLHFTNGYDLHVFADLPRCDEASDCWFIGQGQNYYASWTTDANVQVQLA